MRLQNKVALITGGTSGIGEATAILFAKEGANLAITGRNEKRGHAVLDQILENGGKAIFIRTDVRQTAECRHAVDETLNSFGKLDILINIAGILRDRMIFSMNEEEWDAVIRVHLKGHFCCTHYASIHMRERKAGRIINFSSNAAQGSPGQPA